MAFFSLKSVTTLETKEKYQKFQNPWYSMQMVGRDGFEPSYSNENRFTGIATMRDEMEKMNLPEPEFEALRGTFKVTFRKEKIEIIAQNVAKNCTDNFTENCTDNEMKLLELLKVNSNITQVELSNKLNVSRRTISTLLANLKEKGKIERVGSDRKGCWKILK